MAANLHHVVVRHVLRLRSRNVPFISPGIVPGEIRCVGALRLLSLVLLNYFRKVPKVLLVFIFYILGVF